MLCSHAIGAHTCTHSFDTPPRQPWRPGVPCDCVTACVRMCAHRDQANAPKADNLLCVGERDTHTHTCHEYHVLWGTIALYCWWQHRAHCLQRHHIKVYSGTKPLLFWHTSCLLGATIARCGTPAANQVLPAALSTTHSPLTAPTYSTHVHLGPLLWDRDQHTCFML